MNNGYNTYGTPSQNKITVTDIYLMVCELDKEMKETEEAISELLTTSGMAYQILQSKLNEVQQRRIDFLKQEVLILGKR